MAIQRRQCDDTYSVPRRFGLGAVLVVVTLFAVLFGTSRWTEMSAIDLLGLSCFIVFVGGAQMVLPRFPRLASILVGAVFLSAPLFFAYVSIPEVLVAGGNGGGSPLFVFRVFWCIVFGGLLGYISGTLIAGIFLLLDKFHSAMQRRPRFKSELPAGV